MDDGSDFCKRLLFKNKFSKASLVICVEGVSNYINHRQYISNQLKVLAVQGLTLDVLVHLTQWHYKMMVSRQKWNARILPVASFYCIIFVLWSRSSVFLYSSSLKSNFEFSLFTGFVKSYSSSLATSLISSSAISGHVCVAICHASAEIRLYQI